MSINIINKKESGAIEEVLNALPIFSDDKADIKDIRAIYVVGSEGSPNTQAIYSSYTQGLAYKTVNNGTAVEVKGYTSGLQTAILEGKITSIIIPEYIYSYTKAATTGNGWLPVVGVNIQPDQDLSNGAKLHINSIVVGNNVKYIYKNNSTLGTDNPNKEDHYVGQYFSGAFSGFDSLQEICLPFIGNRLINSTAESCQYPLGYIFGRVNYGATPQTFNYKENSTYTSYYLIPSNLQSVTVTGGPIVRGAFQNCNKIQSIKIPKTTTSIGKQAFQNCSMLQDISILDRLQSIGDYAFDGTSLKKVYIPGTVQSIGRSAFANNISLQEVQIAEGVTKLSPYIFLKCSKLKSVSLPEGLLEINNQAFYMCSALEDIKLPNSVTTIGQEAFKQTALQKISLSKSLKEIKQLAFAANTNLSEITFTGNVLQTIEQQAFEGCSKLTSLAIPNSVTTLSYKILNDCSSLTQLELPFIGTERYTAEISDWKQVFGYLFEVQINSNQQPPSSDYTYQWQSGTNYYHYKIPQSLEKIYINSNKNTSLEHAFYKCAKIKQVVIEGKISSLHMTFWECKGLETAILKANISSIDGTFYSCSSLKTIVIPTSVTTIKDYSFVGCQNLKVYYAGTKSQWNNITINDPQGLNEPLINAPKYYYSETKPLGTGNYWHYADDGITPVPW